MSAFERTFRTLSVLALGVAVAACGNRPESGSGPFGPPKESPLLSPFAGRWAFDFEKTLAAQKEAGKSDEEVERLRKFYSANPQFGKMHPDLAITGDVAIGGVSSEYRFFAMHAHDGKVCGKAWHHEDRFDPGDMTKCYVRLLVKGDRLELTVRMQDGLSDLNDPDLKLSPRPDSGSAATCDADHPPGKDWNEWTTYVFSRAR